MSPDGLTRQDELLQVLGSLARELPEPAWVALVDQDGFMVACYPSDPVIDLERISAMTAVVLTTSERVLTEIEGGQLRYASISGGSRQNLMISLGQYWFLSLGLSPDVQIPTTFRPIRKWAAGILGVLKKRYTST